MGITYIEGTVRGPQGEEQVRFLIDSGPTYTLLPEAVWQKLGLVPKREHTFVLADGRTVTRKGSSSGGGGTRL